jgi:hypothetical protein
MIDPERFKKIDAIFQGALDLEAGERRLYISQACSGDESLLKEVEYLLASDKRDREILKIPAFEMVAPLLAKEAAWLRSTLLRTQSSAAKWP